MPLKRLVGRPPKVTDTDGMKKDRSGFDSMRHANKFWTSTKMRCPCGCGHVFTYAEMWQGLSKEGYSIWDCCDLLKMSHVRIQAVVKTLGLTLEFKGTYDHDTWWAIALKAGYHSPVEMFYHMKTCRCWSFRAIANSLGVPYSTDAEQNRFREVVRLFTDPRRKNVKVGLEEIVRRYPDGKVKQGYDKSKSVFRNIRGNQFTKKEQ